CAGAAMTYLARSTDGGATWSGESPVTTDLSYWTTAYSNIAPNEGDYTALFANQYAVYACWSDGRNNDPDVFMSVVDLACTPVPVALGSITAEPQRVRITWKPAESANLVATVHRSLDSLTWVARGEVASAGVQFVFDDPTVAEGTRYYYRLGLQDPCGETLAGVVAVDVPLRVSLAIEGVQPNPADREIWVSFRLPTAAPATLELLDVAGRRVREQTVTGAGPQTLDVAAGVRLPPGVYLVRLTQAGKSVATRVSVVR
ncbi:MAG: T9SS type A sorting domain-containing protein, partial [Candidatus Eisenbacteria bacterium]